MENEDVIYIMANYVSAWAWMIISIILLVNGFITIASGEKIPIIVGVAFIGGFVYAAITGMNRARKLREYDPKH